MEIDEHSKLINAVFIVWTCRNFILPDSKPACKVCLCYLLTLYTSHLHTSNLYDNRSLIVIITPGVG
jgi:hypothetical protein